MRRAHFRALGVAGATVLWAISASAETLMTADEFETWSTGKTLDYSIDGTLYGSEMHLPGRKTLDADTGGPCHAGHWFPEGDAICFVYDGDPREHCWRFWRDGVGVLAELVDGPPDLSLSQVTEAPAPLSCPGPEVGV
jgi:hypothetical protein